MINRGVRKVNEQIVADGRALVITEKEINKYNWSDIPDGSLFVDSVTGILSVKLDGQSNWVPAGIKNDGTLCIAKDTITKQEIFTIMSIDKGNKEFTYINAKNETRHMPLTDEGYLVFELEQGEYLKKRNYLDIFIDDTLYRNEENGGVIELTYKRFALTEDLEVGTKVTAKYASVFRIGNPYPRIFMCNEIPEESEIGDLWIDVDGTFAENDLIGENNEVNTTISWNRITGTPTTIKGYGIIDPISYDGHPHYTKDIVDFPKITNDGGNADMVDGYHAGTTAGSVLVIQSNGKIPSHTLCAHRHQLSEIDGLNEITHKIDSLFIRGMIIDWYGSLNNIPSGWAVCDGTNGTPDLRNRFVVGAGSSYALGACGGESAHTLSISEMPKHNHHLPSDTSHGKDGARLVPPHWAGGDCGCGTGGFTAAVFYEGSNQPHNNMPPYCALYKIMKL